MKTTPIDAPPTERQAEVLAFLRDYIAAKGYGPTFREINARFGFRSPCAAVSHLDALERRGLLTRVRGGSGSRTIRLTDPSCCPHCRRPFDAPALPPEVMA